MSKEFYVTTTLPYVNAEPHIGFALEIVAADVIARYHRLIGDDVVFNTGTDEHGQKIWQKAIDEGVPTQEYVDGYAAKFNDLKKLLNLSYTNFIRTTDEHHKQAAQEFWRLVDKNGFIYKKKYKIKYCVGCELEKTDSELEKGRCPLHPDKELELREEENYFFKFSEFKKPLLEFYTQNPGFVQPEGKFTEIKSFVEEGLKDFSISRLKEKMPWGIEVPGDPKHVMYVWFDALINYISTLGWPTDKTNFKAYWPAIQLAGKDNLRQQSAMWQAMLMAAGLPNSKKILINGFISIDGQKMSKSLGNVISPSEMVTRYGVDGTRYLLMFLGPFNNDMDVTWEKLDLAYQSKLQHGIGNICSRIAKLCEESCLKPDKKLENRWQLEIGKTENRLQDVEKVIKEDMISYNLKSTITDINLYANKIDEKLSQEKPWKLHGNEQKIVLHKAVNSLIFLANNLQPFMPETAKTIIDHFSSSKIQSIKPLFPRL